MPTPGLVRVNDEKLSSQLFAHQKVVFYEIKIRLNMILDGKLQGIIKDL